MRMDRRMNGPGKGYYYWCKTKSFCWSPFFFSQGHIVRATWCVCFMLWIYVIYIVRVTDCMSFVVIIVFGCVEDVLCFSTCCCCCLAWKLSHPSLACSSLILLYFFFSLEGIFISISCVVSLNSYQCNHVYSEDWYALKHCWSLLYYFIVVGGGWVFFGVHCSVVVVAWYSTDRCYLRLFLLVLWACIIFHDRISNVCCSY